MFNGALPLAEPFAVLDANDARMVDTLDAMEEMGTSVEAVRKDEEARKKKGLPADDAWFWTPYVMLPKASHNANIYLLQDDVPNFLRFWMNSYAAMVAADGKMWEAWHLGNYDPCSAPDNGTAGWFMENFRDLLVMEEGRSLWMARATPRAWLEQGKRIAVRMPRPTSARWPTRSSRTWTTAGSRPRSKSRRGHRREPCWCGSAIPQVRPIKSATVNGRAWSDFDPGQRGRPPARRARIGQSGSGVLILPIA